MTAVLGIDRLLAEPGDWLPAGRVALLTNRAALTSGHVATLDALHGVLGERLALLLSPEHGLGGFGEDATAMPDTLEPRTGLPVASLYGPRRRPERVLLDTVDAIVVDLPDVGVRCYTYATSAALLLEAAAEADVPVIVCDRPSLLGARLDGPGLERLRRSYLGYLDVPFQHGLTLGELMRLHAGTMGGAPLTVVAADGWRRHDPPAGAADFVPPSPGLPAPASVALYPGLVALEGTELSEGRGTPLPFQLVGGPEVDAGALAAAVNEPGTPGVWARPLEFRPESGKLAGRLCRGVQLHVSDAALLRPLALAVRVLRALRAQGRVSWRTNASMPWAGAPGAGEVWHEPPDGLLVDALLGDASLRQLIDGTRSPGAVEASWRDAHLAFRERAEPALLYPGALGSAAGEPALDGPSRSAAAPAAPAAARAGAPEARAATPDAAAGTRLGLGVDAGGSSTRWWLEGPGGSGTGGRLAPLAGHLYGVAGRRDGEARLEELAAAVTAAGRGRVTAVVVGVTGLTAGGEPAAWLRARLAERFALDQAAVSVLDDIELAFRAAFPERDGVLVYAGTGAVAVTSGPDGRRLRAGGHGFLIDDDGGAFSIGRAALRWLLRGTDEAGAPPDTPLARLLWDAAGGRGWDAVRAYVYGGGRAAVAALAPGVARAAAQGDGDAERILGWAGSELARLGRLLLARRGGATAVALAGGVARAGGALEASFRAGLADGVPVRVVAEEPVRLAARLALSRGAA